MKKVAVLLITSFLLTSCFHNKKTETPAEAPITPEVTETSTGETSTGNIDTETPSEGTPNEDQTPIEPEPVSPEEEQTEDELVEETIQEIDDLFKLLEEDGE